MANLVKINDVNAYVGMSTPEGAAEAVKVKKILTDNGIPFNFLSYADDAAHAANNKNLSTWVFGADFKQYQFTDFPVVVWREFYDDYERYVEVAHSAAELLNSNLIKFKDKVVK